MELKKLDNLIADYELEIKKFKDIVVKFDYFYEKINNTNDNQNKLNIDFKKIGNELKGEIIQFKNINSEIQKNNEILISNIKDIKSDILLFLDKNNNKFVSEIENSKNNTIDNINKAVDKSKNNLTSLIDNKDKNINIFLKKIVKTSIVNIVLLFMVLVLVMFLLLK